MKQFASCLIGLVLGISPMSFAQSPPPLPGPASPPPLPAEPEVEWYAGLNGKQDGPFQTSDLAGKIQAGMITAETLVWTQGLKEWQKAGEVSQLASYFGRSGSPAMNQSLSPGPGPSLSPEAGPPAGSSPIEGSAAGEQRVFDGVEMIWCPPTGSTGFMMGVDTGNLGYVGQDLSTESVDPSFIDYFRRTAPPHSVVLTQGFWVAKTECTQKQWNDLLGDHWSAFGSGDNYPLDFHDSAHSFEMALLWCQEQNNRATLPQGWKWTLPTEAQWEYACRAGSTTRYSGSNNPVEMGWFGTGSEEIATQPVATKKPNAWGIHDMHGNVAELCADWYADDYYSTAGGQPMIDPMGPEHGDLGRVIRGDTVHNSSPVTGGSGSRMPGFPVGFRPVISFGGTIKGMPGIEKQTLISVARTEGELRALDLPSLMQAIVPGFDFSAGPESLASLPGEAWPKIETVAQQKIANNETEGVALVLLLLSGPDAGRIRAWIDSLLADPGLDAGPKEVLKETAKSYDQQKAGQ